MDIRSKVSKKFQKFASLSNTFTQSAFEDGVPNIRAEAQNRLHSRCITAIKISSGPDPFVVSAGLDCVLLISHYETGHIIKQIDTNQSFVFSISILQNESMNVIATASQDGNVRIYDCNMNFKCIRVIKQSSMGVCQILWTVVLFNDRHDSPYCLSAGATKTIHVVNWLTRTEVLTLDGHKEGVRCLDISAEGIIASGSNDRTVKLWDFYGKNFIQTLR
jgi:WD40 repeat protein